MCWCRSERRSRVLLFQWFISLFSQRESLIWPQLKKNVTNSSENTCFFGIQYISRWCTLRRSSALKFRQIYTSAPTVKYLEALFWQHNWPACKKERELGGNSVPAQGVESDSGPCAQINLKLSLFRLLV